MGLIHINIHVVLFCFGFQFSNDLYKILGKGEGGKGLRDNLKRRKKINDNLLIVFFSPKNLDRISC